LRTEWRPLPELVSISTEWRDLAARAIEPNVFYEPSFALAAAPLFGSGAGAVLVWAGATPRLVGFFPARAERRRYGVPFPVLVGWTHPYGPLGAPLVDRDAPEPVLTAWLDHIGRDLSLPGLLLLPLLPDQGPLAAAFASVLAGTGRRSAAFGVHARALLAPASRSDYLDHAMTRKKRKELRRQRRRLAERGAVTFSEERNAAIGGALDEFLKVEASGWKGRAGTAAGQSDDGRRFMTRAVMDLAAEGKASVCRLAVADRTVAAAIALRSGNTAWFWKVAYDEQLAPFSPGVLLALDLTDTLLSDPSIMRTDSCATAGHPMIDHVWAERLQLSDRLINLRPRHNVRFAIACGLEAARRALIGAAKSLRDRPRRN
jgi:CelD/BcsL family acetyltransferase involved in cellulose biosynthesis